MSDVRAVVDAVWRIESARVVGAIARLTRDVGVAEECASDAVVEALERWPQSGIPDRPGAWLAAVARMRAIDRIRRNDRLAAITERLAREEVAGDDTAARALDDVPDDVLRLMFTAAHPLLGRGARVALILRLVGGLSVEEIARAFLAAPSTIHQRIVRAKRTLTAAAVRFELPEAHERPQRLGAVLEAIYLVFNEGYAPTIGPSVTRPELCAEALRLARVLAALVPDAPEVLGLLALCELQSSRLRARLAPDGRALRLEEQDRRRWDRPAIQRGLAALAAAVRTGRPFGPYAVQALIASEHARAPSFAETDWERIVAGYDALVALEPSPVAALNRAVAVGMARGPDAGLEALDAIAADAFPAASHALDSVRADLLARAGRHAAAARHFAAAAAQARNAHERELLQRRAAEQLAAR